MNRVFKVVAIFRNPEQNPSWNRGKEGTQAKKQTYVSESDFKKYSPILIKRWKKIWDVKCYELINEKWIAIEDK